MKLIRHARLAIPAMGIFFATPAMAHPGHGENLGFLGGLVHPLTGFDHLAVMVMVGVWAALLPVKAKWSGPATFVAAMIIGFALVPVGLNFGAEAVIPASLVGLPLLILLARRAPLGLQFVAVALFGFAHGFAHGADIGGSPISFAIGMVTATLALHMLGMTVAARHLAPTRLSRCWARRPQRAAIWAMPAIAKAGLPHRLTYLRQTFVQDCSEVVDRTDTNAMSAR